MFALHLHQLYCNQTYNCNPPSTLVFFHRQRWKEHSLASIRLFIFV